MKAHILAALALPLLALGACSDDDPRPEALEGKTYSGMTLLSMTYDEAPMSGKSVALVPDGENAAMTLYSTFDLSQLGDALKGIPPIEAPGVLPGTPKLQIKTALSPKGKGYSFSGSGETDYVTYSYSGRVDNSLMEFNFTGVKLKDLRLAGKVYRPAPLEKNAGGAGWKSSPFHCVWEAELPPQLEQLLPYPDAAGDLMQLLLQLPVIPVYNGTAYMSPAQALASSLQTLAFRDDGCLVATYLQTANGAAQFAHAPICMLQYVPLGDSMIRLYVNPADVLSVVLLNNTNRDPNIPDHPFGKVRKFAGAAGADTARNEELKEYLQQLALKTMLKLSPMLAEGFPMDYRIAADDSMQLYLGQEEMIPVLKDIFEEIVADPKAQALIAALLQQDPSLAQYLPQIKQLLAALPTILEATTRFEFGLNLIPYTAANPGAK